jgi:hypothetical protein
LRRQARHTHTQVVCFRRTEISCYAYPRWEKFEVLHRDKLN